MDLGLAGAISGAGEGASKAVTMGQAQYGAERLQKLRDEGDELRQQRLIEHQAKEGALTRGAAAQEGIANRASATATTDKQVAATEKVHALDRTARSQDSALSGAIQLQIHNDKNKLDTSLANIEINLKRETLTKTELTTLANVITSSQDTLQRLKTQLTDIQTDPLRQGPESKPAVDAMKDDLAKAQRKIDGYERRYQELTHTKPADALAAKPALPPFKMPSSGGTPSSPPVTKAPGLIQVPRPSATEQEMMRKSIEK